jgi:glycosyltransferase involved in cell wall biosynthesis
VARNAGAKLAQGQYLAFTDDDCAPTPDWLTFLAQGLEGAPQAMIGG